MPRVTDYPFGVLRIPDGHTPIKSPFDTIKQIRPDGSEFWSARDLQPLLGYRNWREFNDATVRAKISCEAAGHTAPEQFGDAPKSSPMPNGGVRQVPDYHLTRYACYLVAMNGDPRKPEIAAAQTYFAIQTYRQETQALPTQLDVELLSELRRMAEANAQLAQSCCQLATLVTAKGPGRQARLPIS